MEVPMTDLLNRLARLNRTAVFLGTLIIGLIGIFLPDLLGAVVLLAVVALMLALLRLTWPVTPAGPRLLRLLILGILTGIALSKIL
jgi:hypothetical protein